MHKMRNVWLVALVLSLLVAASAQGQRRVEVQGIPGGASRLLLPGMLFLLSDGQQGSEVEVARRIQFREELSEDYQDFDLQEGDVIAMLDGQPLTSRREFEKFYQQAEVGSRISLGVRRQDEVMVLSFPKPDPASLPQMRLERGAGGEGEHGVQAQGEVMIRKASPQKEKKKEQKPPQ